MSPFLKESILQLTQAEDVFLLEGIQSLWSGYGSIARYGLVNSKQAQVVVKHVQLPQQSHHPRGWNTGLSNERKKKSYQVETAWYESYASQCNDSRIPFCLGVKAREGEFVMVLEDLSSAGFPKRKQSVSLDEMKVCLSWLASFHATFLNTQPTGLWAIGTYWHLDTRPDELEVMDDLPLMAAASAIDQVLRDCPYQTLVHGDAKLANFCFSQDEKNVAAVDFQYVGGGCGVKDVAYFIGSCLEDEACRATEHELLNHYFNNLSDALGKKQPHIESNAVEQAWRELYPYAWADFHRFLKGWSPGHWKLNSYSEQMTQKVIQSLNKGA
ncbi:MAG TPA: choline kinase [Gammaproteobacteria bacterium]|nr:choline kinase [Gammaproteobacteria bacterium]HCK92812.1 choline kinase [Gammaproteobacteria bacterium]|tara:strand:- start:9382 stop:10362 length:981 start_codon:yes stop_codon:yes gene_type:complete